MDAPAQRLAYAEHLPDPRLADHVACYWTYLGTAAPRVEAEPVVPDGAIDLLFDLTDGTGLLVGAMTRPVRVARSGSRALLGVRFRSGAGAAWTGPPAGEVTDRSIPLRAADRGLATWGEQLAEAPTEPAALELLDRLLLARRAARDPTPDPRVLVVARRLRGSRALPRVDVMARWAELGRRQLERRFRAEVGLSPKQAVGVERLRRAILLLLSGSCDPLAGVALRSGYYDQAHFGREFRRLADETPTAFRERRRASHDAFVQDESGADRYCGATDNLRPNGEP